MEKLNRNNADIDNILDKKVAIVCDSKEKELDFRKWAKQYVNAVDEDYVYTNCGNGICICLDYGGLKWDWAKYFLEDNYSIYEWEIAEVIKGGIRMEKLNRNNADIEKLRDKKVAVRLVGQDAEIDFRKWLEENGIHSNNPKLIIRNGIRTEVCYCVEGNSWDWCGDNWLRKNEYEILEWEIAEKENTYTIKDVVENEGKIYKIAGSSGLYKYENGKLLTNALISSCWTTNVLNLKELLEAKFIEYKPEPKKITFEEALKEMETKICRCLFSNRCITICGSQFIDCNNRVFTNLSLPELQSDWVVIE